MKLKGIEHAKRQLTLAEAEVRYLDTAFELCHEQIERLLFEGNYDEVLIRQLLEQQRRLLKLYDKAISKCRRYRHCLHVYTMYQLKHGEYYNL